MLKWWKKGKKRNKWEKRGKNAKKDRTRDRQGEREITRTERQGAVVGTHGRCSPSQPYLL